MPVQPLLPAGMPVGRWLFFSPGQPVLFARVQADRLDHMCIRAALFACLKADGTHNSPPLLFELVRRIGGEDELVLCGSLVMSIST
jgi:hypothetical protein